MSKKYSTELIHKTTLQRSKNDKYIPLTPSSGQVYEGCAYEPERLVDAKTAGTLKSGDRILHKSKTGKSGRSLYEDPDFWS